MLEFKACVISLGYLLMLSFSKQSLVHSEAPTAPTEFSNIDFNDVISFENSTSRDERSSDSTLSFSSRVTSKLNDLLRNYDQKVRPGYGGPPMVVKVFMNIRSIGPISERDMTYSLDAYFRQTWTDERLRWEGDIEQVAVHIKMLDQLWKPDTFFYNGQGAYVHTTTTPNKLLRIRQDGTVLYSMRITIKATCPMYLQSFPIDEQFCPLQLGSYAYTDKHVLYMWKQGMDHSITTASDLRLSQFDLRGHPASNSTVTRLNGNYSSLDVQFVLERHLGYFILQLYLPCTLVVVLSWVSFWLNREATADRVGLGVTAFLTLTTLSLEGKASLPVVPYATALDWFIFLCFSFIFASILEFAGVHYFTKFDYGDPPVSDSEEDYEDQEEDVYTIKMPGFVPIYSATEQKEHLLRSSGEDTTSRGGRAYRDVESTYLTPNGGDAQTYSYTRDSCLTQFIRCLQSSSGYKRIMVARGETRRSHRGKVNSTSIIDRVSRYVFPISFIVLYTMYWVAFMT